MKATDRFSNRVDDYIRFRPGYPREVVTFLLSELGLSEGASVADIGSGTGIFTALLLEAGLTVFGVEPNAPMRAAAERLLAAHDRFRSVDGTAESTTLASASVDAVTAAQAFHWFDVPRARDEFRRILRPGGFVALLWNDRRDDVTEFAREYQELIDEFNTDLGSVDHRRLTRDDAATVREFFGASGTREKRFANHQDLDFDGLRGRLVSSSYIPSPGAPRYDEMIEALGLLFDRHSIDGHVRLDYDTRVFYGTLGGEG
jgi:SAM-dependent methyltransferase